MQRVVKRPPGVTAGVAGRRFGDADRNGRNAFRCPEFARDAQGGLRRGLRKIAGRSGLVVDGHDLGLGAGEQTNIGGGRLAAEGGEQSSLALQDCFRSAGARFRQFDRRNCVAGRKARMEVHFGAAGARPFVQAGRRVGGDGNCTSRSTLA